MKTNDKHEAASRIAPWGLSLVGVLVTALICTDVSRAQSNAALASTPAAKPGAALASAISAPAVKAPTPPAAKPSSQGPHDGIAVHGYWIIDVRNPDGKLAKHMEFENQLCTTFVDPTSGGTVPGGDSTLAAMLSGSRAPGAWSIVFGTPELAQLPGGGPGGGGFGAGPNCAFNAEFFLSQSGVQGGSAVLGTITYSLTGAPPPAQVAPFAFGCSGNCFPTLNVSSPPNISLSGQFTVPPGNPVSISAVGTDLFTCLGTNDTQVTNPFGNGTPAGPETCQNAGNAYGQNAGQAVGAVPHFACNAQIVSAFQSGPTVFAYQIEECFPGLPTTIVIPTYQVAGQYGRSPFSGVVLTGTGGVPGPFQVSAGQTVAVTWTLSFQ
jgi:hypothetical protein